LRKKNKESKKGKSKMLELLAFFVTVSVMLVDIWYNLKMAIARRRRK